MDRRAALKSGLAATVLLSAGCTGNPLDGNDETTKRTKQPSSPPHTLKKIENKQEKTTKKSDPVQIPSHLVGLSGNTGPDPDNKKMKRRNFAWQHSGRQAGFSLKVPVALYNYYLARTRTPEYGAYISDRYDDFVIQGIADEIKSVAKRNNYSDAEMVNYAISFVQNMKYTKDTKKDYNEYPKYPLETIMERGGDCEDTSILMAAILEKLQYGSVLFIYPDAAHAAIGIKGLDSLSGTYVTYKGDRYYYVETTSGGWRVGQAPDHVMGHNPQVQQIRSHPVIVFSWAVRVNPSGVTVPIKARNLGDATAKNAKVQVEFETKNGNIAAQKRTKLPKIPQGKQKATEISVSPPANKALKVRVGILLNGHLHDLDESELRKP